MTWPDCALSLVMVMNGVSLRDGVREWWISSTTILRYVRASRFLFAEMWC